MKHIKRFFIEGLCQKIKIQLFSEQGHVAYQIKGNHERSNMVTTILFADTPFLPKMNLGVGELGFMFCDLFLSLK